MKRTIALAALAGALALAGCGGDDDPKPATAAKPSLDVKLPAAIEQAGKIRWGTTLPNVPYLLTDSGNTITGGIVPDVGKEVSKRLGLEYQIQNVAWEALLTGIAAGRYDAADDGISDTVERQRNGIFVDYMETASVLATSKDNAGKYTSEDAVCGKTIAAIRGTTDVETAGQISKKCTDAGKPAASVKQYPTAQDADLALRSGRTDFEIQVKEGAAYAISKGAPLHIVSEGYGKTYVGMVVNPKLPELADALLAALKDMKADGTLDRIMAKYDLKALDEPGINLAKE